jgi:hypothetical protein
MSSTASWLGGVETGFEDKLAAAFDDMGIRLACIVASSRKGDGGVVGRRPSLRMFCVAFAWFGVGVRRRLWRWRGPKIKVMVIALYRCGAVLVAERRYKLKVCSTAGRSGDKQTVPVGAVG